MTIEAVSAMNGYDLTASLFSSLTSLAWPVAVIVCVYLFRERLSEILPFLKLRHKETEISFQLEAAKEEAKSLPPAPPNVPRSTLEERQKVIEIARLSPSAAMLNTWTDFETRLREIVADWPEVKAQSSDKLSAKYIMRIARNNRLISSEIFSLYNDLQNIRNQVAHNSRTTATGVVDALNFAQLIDRVLSSIEQLPRYREEEPSEEEVLAAHNLPPDELRP